MKCFSLPCRPKARRAFTLIELLIVVAIIAILAAIAVPNFLEAQIRSKVSRSKADMRSMATAIEGYAVDHNRYPISYEPIPSGMPRYYSSNFWLRRLTTPVAFMTALPNDPFMIPQDRQPTDYGDRTFLYNMYTSEDAAIVGLGISLSDVSRDQAPGAWPNDFDRSGFGYVYANGFRWSLTTVGPSLTPVGGEIEYVASLNNTSAAHHNVAQVLSFIPNPTQNPGYLFIYDPTNGTKSGGYIIDTNQNFVDGSSARGIYAQ